MKKVIDVSSWQGKIDWEKVKPKVDGAILRAGWGNNNIDPQFKRNITECNRLGIPVGVYWFSYGYTDEMAKREAEFCYNAIKDYKIQLPVFYDWEYDSMNYAKKCGKNPTKTQITNWNKIFIDYFTAKKISTGCYYNKDYSNNYIDINKLTGFRWFALYGTSTKPAGTYDMWQFGTERYTGISGAVDTNYVYNDKIFTTTVVKPTEPVKKGYSGTFPTLPSRGYFKKGDKGTQVVNLQKFLLWYSPNCLQRYGADGDLGNETVAAVKKFQSEQKITADGLFGKNSLAKAKSCVK